MGALLNTEEIKNGPIIMRRNLVGNGTVAVMLMARFKSKDSLV